MGEKNIKKFICHARNSNITFKKEMYIKFANSQQFNAWLM